MEKSSNLLLNTFKYSGFPPYILSLTRPQLVSWLKENPELLTGIYDFVAAFIVNIRYLRHDLKARPQFNF